MKAMVFFKSQLYHTSPSDSAISSRLLTPLIIPPRMPLNAFFTFLSGDFLSFLCLFVSNPSLPSSPFLRLPRLSLLGDSCVRADRDILYLSYLFPWENWCVMLTRDDGQRCLEITHLKKGRRKHIDSVDDALVSCLHVFMLLSFNILSFF